MTRKTEKTCTYSELEKSCISMIDSILCYGKLSHPTDEVVKDYYLTRYVSQLGEQRVKELIDEQKRDIHHINYHVGEDHEGCVYNSITYVDEI